MPSLPQIPNPNNSEIMEKAGTSPGVFLRQPVELKRDFWRSLQGALVFVVFFTSFSLTLFGFFAFEKVKSVVAGQAPLLQAAKTEEFKYPPNISDVIFPNDISKKKFMDKMTAASKEKDKGKRYKILEEGFVTLAGLYSQDQNSDTRIILQQYKVYMEQMYPGEMQARGSVYKILCLDILCGKENYPAEIAKIKDGINSNDSLAEPAKRGILDILKNAALQTDKNVQSVYYLNALSAIYSQFEVAKNEKTKVSYEELLAYIQKTYPDTKIPDSILVKQ